MSTIKRFLVLICGLCAASLGAATASRTATENFVTNKIAAALAPYCTIAAAQQMTNDVMDEVRGGFLPATADSFMNRHDVGGTVGFSGTVEINGGAYGLVLGEWSDVFCRYDGQTLPSYLARREAALMPAITNAVREVVYHTADYIWDARDHVCYRREFSGGYLAYIAVTNIDLTNPTNYAALAVAEEARR